MFGKPHAGNNGAAPSRPAAADVAQIQSGGLTQVIVTGLAPLTFYLFLIDRYVVQEDVDNLSVDIETEEANPLGVVVRGTLAHFVTAISGEREQQRTELLPGTIEIVALGRRIAITCPRTDLLDETVIELGLKPDGTSHTAQGVRSLRVLLMEGLLDASLTWVDGETEALFPQ